MKKICHGSVKIKSYEPTEHIIVGFKMVSSAGEAEEIKKRKEKIEEKKDRTLRAFNVREIINNLRQFLISQVWWGMPNVHRRQWFIVSNDSKGRKFVVT